MTNQTPLTDEHKGRRGPWKRFTTLISGHTRHSQRAADADAVVAFETCDKRSDLGIEVSETFTTANGHRRTCTIAVTLSAENVERLRAVLAEIDTTVENP